MQKEIKYIGFYENPLGKSKRNQALSATNKMDYIATALYEAGVKVHMVSPSWMLNDKAQPVYEKTTTNKVLSWKKVTAVSSWRTSTKLGGYFKILWSLIWLFGFLVKNVKKGEKILVYHSPWLALPIILAKKIKHFHLILEVEEIYSKVWTINNFLTVWEKKLINAASSYIIVSELLGNYLPKKPKIIIYGNYNTQNGTKLSRNEKEIKIVYAGSIDDTKGGANNIVDCVDFLPEIYKIKIIGYGNKKDIEQLKSKINLKRKNKNIASCDFYGVKRDKEYSEFLLNCDIGVNSQTNGTYMQTAFPSKILSYLSHNLTVVSTPIESVKNSELASYVCFSEEDTPQSIAQAIQNIDFKKLKDPREKLKELHVEFVDELKKELSNE